MQRYAVLLAGAATFLAANTCQAASAYFLDGSKFVTACGSTDALQLGVCLGYIQGVADSLAAQQLICLPTIGVRELRVVVVRSLNAKPEELPQPAIALIARSLHDTYPCGKQSL
jgi:hypothetical protein